MCMTLSHTLYPSYSVTGYVCHVIPHKMTLTQQVVGLHRIILELLFLTEGRESGKWHYKAKREEKPWWRNKSGIRNSFLRTLLHFNFIQTCQKERTNIKGPLIIL